AAGRGDGRERWGGELLHGADERTSACCVGQASEPGDRVAVARPLDELRGAAVRAEQVDACADHVGGAGGGDEGVEPGAVQVGDLAEVDEDVPRAGLELAAEGGRRSRGGGEVELT